eukprot:2972703-Lingulodinium_polyedra.AAC.1
MAAAAVGPLRALPRANGPLRPPTTEERLGGWRPAKCRTGAERGSCGYAAAGLAANGGIGATHAAASPT